MSGAYAHLTLVGLLSSSNALDRVENFPVAAKISLLDYTNFCELGAVSPDYPYLGIADAHSSQWADLMHYQDVDKVISCGVESIRMLDGENRQKLFAWFSGFIAHIVTDMTIHPVIELKVGPYEQNKTQHRICEMNQDSYIFPLLNVGNVGASEYLNSGIATCCDNESRNKLSQSVSAVWDDMLKKCYPDQYLCNIPKINKWHISFLSIVDLAEEGSQLFAFARHVAVGTGLTYPGYDKIDMQYITALDTPVGTKHFDEIFSYAQNNVLRMWALIAAAIYENSDGYKKILGKWNLDTGRDSNDNLVFWSG